MKLKDYVTLGNLLGGFAAVLALMHDEFQWACYLIYVAYAFDVADGAVARITKQYDTFGGYFDSACDFVTNSVVTGFIVYYAFHHNAGWPWWIAAILGAFPISYGTIRQARQQDQPSSFPCYWLGLPRPVASLFIVALLSSSLWSVSAPYLYVVQGVSALMVVVLSHLHLSSLPFVNNKRRFVGSMKVGMIFFLAGSPIFGLVAWLGFGQPEWFFEYILFALTVYICLSWTQIPKTDLQRIRDYLAGGEVVLPLVHKESDWMPSHWLPYFEKPSEQ